MLDALLAISTVAFIVAGAVVGVRLLRLAMRTHELTDYIVACSVLVLSPITYPLILVGTLGNFSLDETKLLSSISTTLIMIGWTGVFIFTQRVFRSGEMWARVFVGVGIAVIWYDGAAGIAFIQAAPDRAALQSPHSPLLWVQVAAIVVYAWSAFEGFRCWTLARRRLALGLADPLVVNRFLLWGFIGLSSLLSIVPSLVISLSGGNGMTHVGSRLCTAIGGLSASIALQLAFLPPAGYRRWVEARAAA
ncbi:MAG TPA: hypothetical protein VII78_01245 [Myxococcota bacterium]|jgi:hypothetical protein